MGSTSTPTTRARNARAMRAYEKVGFVREGILRESFYRNVVCHDTIVMSVLESEWRGACD